MQPLLLLLQIEQSVQSELLVCVSLLLKRFFIKAIATLANNIDISKIHIVMLFRLGYTKTAFFKIVPKMRV